MPRRQKRIKNDELRIKNKTAVGSVGSAKAKSNFKIKVRVKKSKKQVIAQSAEETWREPAGYQPVENEAPKADITDQDKKMIMWSGITFFMVLIIGFWLFNIKTIFKTDSNTANGNQQFNWNNIKGELNQTMAEVKKNLSEIKNLQNQTMPNTLPSGNISSSTEQKIEQLKEKLLSDTTAASTATATP